MTPFVVGSLMGIGFGAASFLSWREAYQKSQSVALRATLYKVRDLIVNTKNEIEEKKFDSFGALLRFSDELRTEEDVNWVCSELSQGGHAHPFGLLELTSNHACKGLRLSLLQEARASSINIIQVRYVFHFAANQWSHKDMYVKGHVEYAKWEAENPNPEGIKLLPRLDAREPASEEQRRNDTSLKLTRYLHAGNQILNKCRSLSAVEVKAAEDWARDVGALVHIIAGEIGLGKFLDQSGISHPIDPPHCDARMGLFMEQKAVFDFVYPRCFRLRQLIDDIESGRVVPFAKPFL